MYLNEFCERILFGQNLEDKLTGANNIELNGTFKTLRQTPILPGRPPELAFDRPGTSKLPSVHQLDDDKNRGLLLHFFLNHE